MVSNPPMKNGTNSDSEQTQTNSGCSLCGKSKAPYQCGCCNETLCKSCVQFMPDDAFQFMTHKPKEISHNHYCNPCFDLNVVPALAVYEEIAERARELAVFDVTQGKETRFIRRLERPMVLESGVDAQDITMRLAYMAAEKNYNAIVDLDIKAYKVRDGAYQTTAYSGKAIPVILDTRKLMKDRSLRTNYSDN